MDSTNFKPILRMHTKSPFRGVLVPGFQCLHRLRSGVSSLRSKLLPLSSWITLRQNALQDSHVDYYFCNTSRIWRLPYRRIVNTRVIRPNYFNIKLHHHNVVNSSFNKHLDRFLPQYNMIKKHKQALGTTSGTMSGRLRLPHQQYAQRSLSVMHTARRMFNGVQPGSNPIKNRRSITISWYQQQKNIVSTVILKQVKPKVVLHRRESPALSANNSDTQNYHQALPVTTYSIVHDTSRQKLLDHNPYTTGTKTNLPTLSRLVVVKNIARSSWYYRLIKRLDVLHHDSAFSVNTVKHHYTKMVTGNVLANSKNSYDVMHRNLIPQQKLGLKGNTHKEVATANFRRRNVASDDEAFAVISKVRDSLLQESRKIPARDDGLISTLSPHQLSPVQKPYVYSHAGLAKQVSQQTQESGTETVIKGLQIKTPVDTQWIEQKIEQQLKKHFSGLEKGAFSPKRVARGACQSLTKQLIRERERIGR